MGASLSRATKGGSSRTMSVFSVITPWYDVSIHGLCLFTAETESKVWCQWNTTVLTYWYCISEVSLHMESVNRWTVPLFQSTCTLYTFLGGPHPFSDSTRHSQFVSPLKVPFSIFCPILYSDIPHRFHTLVKTIFKAKSKQSSLAECLRNNNNGVMSLWLCTALCWPTCHLFTGKRRKEKQE